MTTTAEAKKFVVVIHSTLAPDRSRALSYSNTRSVFTNDERLAQTVVSIRSLRSRIPNAKILLADNSETVPNGARETLAAVGLDYFLHCFDAETAHSPHKGLGVAMSDLNAAYFIDRTADWKDFDFMMSLAGRYRLNDDFRLEQFTASPDKMTFYREPPHPTNLICYAVPKSKWSDYKTAMQTIRARKSDVSLEHQLFELTRPHATYLSRLGAEGFCAVDGTLLRL